MTVEDSDQACSSCLPSRPLAQTCVVCGRTPPRFFFFVLSGSACNGVQLAIDRVLALVLPPNTWWVPTFCWTVSYAASVSFRFVSHAAIVFGPHRDPPLLALGKTYCTYLSTIVASTAVNLALVAGLGLAHEVALVPTAAFSVCWSYIALSYTWRDSTGKSGSLLCCARDGNHRQTWYRAVDADHATPEEHTPMSQRHASFASKLASAAWLAPGVLESAGLTPQQRERAISQASQEMDLLGGQSSTSCGSSPGPPLGLGCCSSFDGVAIGDEVTSTSPPRLRALIDKDEVLIDSPCSPRPIAIPRM